MDVSTLLPSDWSALELISRMPDSIVAALVSALATLVLLLCFGPKLGARQPHHNDDEEGSAAACDFTINGTSVKALTEPAGALIDGFGPAASRLAALGAHLSADCPGIQKDIEALVLYGTAFRHHCPRGDGTALEILGEPRGGAAFVSIRPASEDARALQDARNALERSAREIRFLRDVIDCAPVVAWAMAPDGKVSWANAPYRDRFDSVSEELPDHRIPDAFAHVLEEVPLTARGNGVRRRVAIPGPREPEPQWFELSQSPGADGDTLGFALPADDLVATEATLRRFVETLTETFAHLPIGLAVFDKNRRLGLFNPALTDLVKIDAVWLAGRPSLRDFLERLRETRQMPDQKDFASWRRKLSELEEGARDGTYEENWVLPSGKIFRVTGRPHPQGALAFLFEDISTSVMLERKYRSELELSQATLDRMVEAVAVFDTTGALVFVNSAFESLWGLDPMQSLGGPGVTEMTRLCAERCAPNPVWPQLVEYATGEKSRNAWTAQVATLDGRQLHMLVAPLPDASALVVFRDLTAERAGIPEGMPAPEPRDNVLEDLALEQIQLPVETAIRQIMGAIPAAQSPEAFKALSSAAQGLKDGLARSRELRSSGPSGEAASTDALARLAAMLRGRGLSLAAADDVATWEPGLRRAALTLGLAAADLAAPEAEIAVALDLTGGERVLRVETLAAPGSKRVEKVSLTLARRLTEASGGTLRLADEDGKVVILATLPPAGAKAPASGIALRA